MGGEYAMHTEAHGRRQSGLAPLARGLTHRGGKRDDVIDQHRRSIRAATNLWNRRHDNAAVPVMHIVEDEVGTGDALGDLPHPLLPLGISPDDEQMRHSFRGG